MGAEEKRPADWAGWAGSQVAAGGNRKGGWLLLLLLLLAVLLPRTNASVRPRDRTLNFYVFFLTRTMRFSGHNKFTLELIRFNALNNVHKHVLMYT